MSSDTYHIYIPIYFTWKSIVLDILASSSVLIWLGCTRISFLRFFKVFQNQIVFGDDMFRGTNKFHWILTDRDKCKCTINNCGGHIAKYFQGYSVHHNRFLFYIITFVLQERFVIFPSSCLKPRSADCSSLVLLLGPHYCVLCTGLETVFLTPIACAAAAVQWDTQELDMKYMSNSIFCLHFTLTPLLSCKDFGTSCFCCVYCSHSL